MTVGVRTGSVKAVGEHTGSLVDLLVAVSVQTGKLACEGVLTVHLVTVGVRAILIEAIGVRTGSLVDVDKFTRGN